MLLVRSVLLLPSADETVGELLTVIVVWSRFADAESEQKGESDQLQRRRFGA